MRRRVGGDRLLTRVPTTGLDDLGRAWSGRRPGRPLSRAGCQPWTPVDDPRLTRNVSLSHGHGPDVSVDLGCGWLL